MRLHLGAAAQDEASLREALEVPGLECGRGGGAREGDGDSGEEIQTGGVLGGEEQRREGYMLTPFESLPADSLVHYGFVQSDGRDQMYYAPDAGVLLSDPFLDTHCFRLASGREGLVGLAFSNSPSAMAPWGGSKGTFGTNPIAFACPLPDREPIVVDLSLSKVARGKVMVAAQQGKPIPVGWALDRYGAPTTDAKAALAGMMLPAGGVKGAMLALMVGLPLLFLALGRWVAPHAPGSEFSLLVMVGLVAAFATYKLGVYYLVGAFIAGVGTGGTITGVGGVLRVRDVDPPAPDPATIALRLETERLATLVRDAGQLDVQQVAPVVDRGGREHEIAENAFPRPVEPEPYRLGHIGRTVRQHDQVRVELLDVPGPLRRDGEGHGGQQQP